MGATTIWERWNALNEDGVAFGSADELYNHYAYGAVCQWLLEAVAGFRPDPDAPAFAHVIFEPLIIRELSPVKATTTFARRTHRRGMDRCRDAVTYTVNVPSNARGTLILSTNYVRRHRRRKPLASAERQRESAKACSRPVVTS